MKVRQLKHRYATRMRNPESNHAATRRILRELRESMADLHDQESLHNRSTLAAIGAAKRGDTTRVDIDEL